MKEIFHRLVLLPLLFSGCTDNLKLPPRFATGLTIVAVSETGMLIEAVSIPSDESISSVVIRVPDDVDRMQLVLWGDRIHKEIPKDTYFTATNRKLHGFGECRVDFEKGIVIGVMGNGFASPFVMPPGLVDRVMAHIDSGESPLDTTEIERHEPQ